MVIELEAVIGFLEFSRRLGIQVGSTFVFERAVHTFLLNGNTVPLVSSNLNKSFPDIRMLLDRIRQVHYYRI